MSSGGDSIPIYREKNRKRLKVLKDRERQRAGEVIVNKIVKLLGVLLVISLSVLPLVGCGKQLSLTIYTPTEGATITESPVKVWGYVSDSKATVRVNNVVVVVSEEFYSTQFKLTEGENIIQVIATLGEVTITNTVTVTYSPEK